MTKYLRLARLLVREVPLAIACWPFRLWVWWQCVLCDWEEGEVEAILRRVRRGNPKEVHNEVSAQTTVIQGVPDHDPFSTMF